MSFLLAIIAIQLVNISGKLEMSGRLSADRRECLRLYAYQRGKEPEIARSAALKTATILDIDPEGLIYYCNSLD